MIRDVAYAGITKERRAVLHERFGTWLGRREENVEEVVGYHLEQAHHYRTELRPNDPELPALAQRAGERLTAAGMRAWKGADNPAAINLLGRAAPLLQALSQRAETLCELGIAQRFTDLEAADATLSDALACAREVGDRRIELRARIELSYLRLFTDRAADPSELVALVRDASPLFEELGDERALARAWRHVGYVLGSMEGRCAEWADAVERALVYYRRTGWSAAGCLVELGAALLHGPTPAPKALARCEELLAEATDRLGSANMLVYVGAMHALSERYDEAFALVADADRIYDELGEVYTKADHSTRIRGWIHLLAGEGEPAEAALAESSATLERMRDEPGLSSVASALGDALYLQERFEEARRWSALAKERAPVGDRVSQISWRSLEAKLLAERGEIRAAEALVTEALGMVELTDALTYHGNVLLDAAAVQRAARRYPEAARRLEQAIALFEAKGNAAAVRLAEARLDEVAVP